MRPTNFFDYALRRPMCAASQEGTARVFGISRADRAAKRISLDE